jgi:uridine kinase
MESVIQQAIYNRIKDLLQRDSQQETPVVQAVSLFFWQNLTRWVQQIAFIPESFTIALCGPSGCGKSFIREVLVQRLSEVSSVSSFTQDNYYRDFEADFAHLPLARFYDEIDFDDPAHIRFRHLQRDLRQLKSQQLGTTVKIPRLCFGTPLRKPTIKEQAIELPVSPFVVTEGIHAFYDPTILPLYDLKIYVDVDEATRRARWLERNRLENRGVTDNMWNTTVQCLHQCILPTRPVADLVLNNAAPQAQVTTFLQEVVQVMSTPLQTSNREIA